MASTDKKTFAKSILCAAISYLFVLLLHALCGRSGWAAVALPLAIYCAAALVCIRRKKYGPYDFAISSHLLSAGILILAVVTMLLAALMQKNMTQLIEDAIIQEVEIAVVAIEITEMPLGLREELKSFARYREQLARKERMAETHEDTKA